MDINKKIKNLRGEEISKSFPTQKEIDDLPKNSDGKPDFSKLEKETVINVILNCLANYTAHDRKDGFYINCIAQSILDCQNKKRQYEPNKKFKSFLIEVLEESMIMAVKDDKGTEKITGLYQSWAIAQVLNELGCGE